VHTFFYSKQKHTLGEPRLIVRRRPGLHRHLPIKCLQSFVVIVNQVWSIFYTYNNFMFSVLRNRRLPCWGDEKCRNARKHKKNILVGDRCRREGNNRCFLRKLDGTGTGCSPETGSCECSYTNYVVLMHTLASKYI
jgi:hypothetical protein